MSGASKADRMPLGGRHARALARELALGDLNQTQLAEKYGVTPSAVSQFKTKHAEEIAAIKADADDEYAGMWIAQKQARLAEYERIHGIALTPTPKVDNKGNQIRDPETGDPIFEVQLSEAQKALKQAAEEMGQLPSRLQIQGDLQTTTVYRFEGVNPDALT